MKIRWLVMAALCGLVSPAVLAHGNKVHVSGTIEKISADSVHVKTRDGKSVEVKLTTSTVYLLHVVEKTPNASSASTDKPAKVGDLVAGDAVVIHATPKGDALEADEVRFTVPIKASPATALQKPKS